MTLVSCAVLRMLLVPIRGVCPSASNRVMERHRRPCAVRQDQGVACVFSRQHGAERQTLGKHGRHVLAAVDGDINRAVEERVLDLLDEQALATGFGQRCVREPIAGRLDHGDFARDSGVRLAALPPRCSPGTARADCRAFRVSSVVMWTYVVCAAPR